MPLPEKPKQVTDTHGHRYCDEGKQKQVNQKRNIGQQRPEYSARKLVHIPMSGLCFLLHLTETP